LPEIDVEHRADIAFDAVMRALTPENWTVFG
jgi:hypothetical protein